MLFPPARSDHIAALDGVRGFAMLLVFLSHASNAGMDLIPGLDFGGAGKAGVWLFFVLSAYLLTAQLLELRHRGELDGRAWRRYASRRVLRIYPMYALYLAGAWLLGAMTGQEAWRHLLMRDGTAHLWSIPVEFAYYAVLPFVVLAYTTLLRGSLLAITLTTGAVVATLALFPLPFVSDQLPAYLAIFLLGSYSAVLIRGRSVRGAQWLALAALAVAVLMTPSVWSRIVAPIAPDHWHRSFTLFGLLWCAFLCGLLLDRGWLQRVFSAAPLRVLGVVSFSAYLLHPAIIQALPSHGWLVLATTVAASAVTYLLIERPAMRLRLSREGWRDTFYLSR